MTTPRAALYIDSDGIEGAPSNTRLDMAATALIRGHEDATDIIGEADIGLGVIAVWHIALAVDISLEAGVAPAEIARVLTRRLTEEVFTRARDRAAPATDVDA
jgi:hypothetical protein